MQSNNVSKVEIYDTAGNLIYNSTNILVTIATPAPDPNESNDFPIFPVVFGILAVFLIIILIVFCV